MRPLRFYVFLFFLLALAAPAPASVHPADTPGQAASRLLTPEDYQSRLDQLDFTKPASSLQGLKLFRDQLDKSQPARNDQAFAAFLVFQHRLIDSLNEDLFRQQDLWEKINAYQLKGRAKADSQALAYVKELKQNGLELGVSENQVYLRTDPILLHQYFYPYLSAAGKEFLSLYGEEETKPYWNDAGLALPVQEVAERLVRWDSFHNRYPAFPLQAYSRSYHADYLVALLSGLDNTPAFDYKTQNLQPDFRSAYDYVLKQYPRTRAAGVLRDYQKLLEQCRYRYSPDIQAFIDRYRSE